MGNDFDATLGQYGRRQLLLAEESDEEASRLREQIRRLPEHMVGQNARHAIARDTAFLEEQVSAAERKARVLRRRAAYADRGYLLASPDERNDKEWMTRYQQLYIQSNALGLTRNTGDTVDQDDADPAA